MTQSLPTSSLNHILEQNPETILTWVNSSWSSHNYETKEFNWLLLANVAAINARNASSNDSNPIKWAEIAITVYDQLVNLAEKQRLGSGESFMISAMMLRTAMIEKFGLISNHPVLDASLILNWFWGNLKYSQEELAKKVADWRSLPIEDIRNLRKLKNQLKVILALANSDKYALDEELKSWLYWQDKLP